MNHDEDMILGYLRKFPNAFVSAMEICKRAGDRRRFAAEPDWAKPVLVRMAQQHILESNITGQYRIKPEEEEEKPKKHGRPYEPRPEPPAPLAASTNLKPDATASPSTAEPSGEKEKTPPLEVVPHPAAVGANGDQTRNDAPAQSGGCKHGETQTNPCPPIEGSTLSKKAA